MTRASLKNYKVGTPEYVVMHARYQRSRGRKPSATLTYDFDFGTRNPKVALRWAEVFAHFPKIIDINLAKKIAQIFMRYSEVKAVEVFGSVARTNVGKDLDLILITDKVVSDEFIEAVTHELWQRGNRRSCYSASTIRHNIAEIILDASERSVDNRTFQDAVNEADEVGLDIFIFPPDWRDRLEELQDRMRHQDPDFMWKIAKDARKIA